MSHILHCTDKLLGAFSTEYPDKDTAIDAYNHIIKDPTVLTASVIDDEKDILIRDFTRG